MRYGIYDQNENIVAEFVSINRALNILQAYALYKEKLGIEAKISGDGYSVVCYKDKSVVGYYNIKEIKE